MLFLVVVYINIGLRLVSAMDIITGRRTPIYWNSVFDVCTT